jgi:hypothetical protein
VAKDRGKSAKFNQSTPRFLGIRGMAESIEGRRGGGARASEAIATLVAICMNKDAPEAARVTAANARSIARRGSHD